MNMHLQDLKGGCGTFLIFTLKTRRVNPFGGWDVDCPIQDRQIQDCRFHAAGFFHRV